MMTNNLRVGHGFDVHRFSEVYDAKKPLRLAGVTVKDKKSLIAHSDGDVVLHALCDAILGAIAAGDIGQHFPDNDATYAGADSADLLRQVMQLAAKQRFSLINVDVTVVAQVPKLSAYRQQMLERLAQLLILPINRVNIKATTTEGLGYIGREEGIACHAVVLLGSDA